MNRRDYESIDLAGAAHLAEGARSAHSGTFPSCPEDEYPRREAVEDNRRRDPVNPLDDPMFGALHLLARDQEELARLAYGDGPVESALARIAEEEGL